jgi:hypothetical protein
LSQCWKVFGVWSQHKLVYFVAAQENI